MLDDDFDIREMQRQSVSFARLNRLGTQICVAATLLVTVVVVGVVLASTEKKVTRPPIPLLRKHLPPLPCPNPNPTMRESPPCSS